jgi:membrane associated rhomboid family serine protease
MVGWFVLCAVGVIPNVANWAHGVGLGVGAFLGALPYIGQQLRQKT